MKEVKIGLIGAGEIAQNFHLPILYRIPNVKIEAIFDPQLTKSEIIADKYDIPKVCETIEDMLAIEELDAVDICASTDAHSSIALQAIKAGKNCIIEKPIARDYAEALEIHEAAKEAGVKVMIGTNQRFRHDAKMLKSFVHNDELGDVFYVQAQWQQQKRGADWKQIIKRAGGGVVMDLGFSLIDSLLWIFDFAPVKSVSATMFKHMTGEVEDVCIGSIRFKDDKIATLEMSWSLFTAKNNYAFNVYGRKGSARVNPLQLYRANGDTYEPETGMTNLSNLAIYKKSFESELKHFVNTLLDYGPVISTTEQACRTMQIIDGFYKSDKEGIEVVLD
jgi:predicted dehydrogenase